MTLQYTCTCGLIISERTQFMIHEFFKTHQPINMYHGSIPQNHINQVLEQSVLMVCSNAYSHPRGKGLWINVECPNAIKHALNLSYFCNTAIPL